MAESKETLSHESEPQGKPQSPLPGEPASPKSQPEYSPALPQYSPAQPQYSPAQPQYSPAQPQYSQAQPQYSPAQPQYGGQQQYGEQQQYGGQPQYGEQQQYGGQPQYGEQQQYGGQPQVVTTQPVMNTSNTTVVIGGTMGEVKGPRDWNDGLCGCFNDCGSCCRGVFCPGGLLLEISNRLGEGCCFVCCCPGALLGLRIKLRMQENIQGTLFDDYRAVQFCYLCVLCQMARELNYVKR